MKCINCNREISDSSNFCVHCGTQQQLDNHSGREALLNALHHVNTEAAKCTPYYDIYNSLERDVDRLSRLRWSNRLWKLPFFLGLPFAFAFSILSLPSAQRDMNSDGGAHGSYNFIFIILVAAWLAIWISLIHVGNRRVSKKNEDNQRKISELVSQQSDILLKVTKNYNNAGISDFYPKAYFYEYAASCIYTYILNRQADNLKEAMNLYENHLHHLRMEQGMNKQLESLQRAEALLTRIDANSKAAAVSSSIAAIGSFIR